MSTTRIAILMLASLIPAPASSFAQRFSGSGLPSTRMLDRYGLKQVWWNQATMDAGRETVRHVVIYEDTIFVQSSGGMVSAFDAETGRRLWASQLGRRDQPNQPLVCNDDDAFIVVGISLYSVNRRTGATNWRIDLKGAPSTSPAVDDRRIYLGMRDGSVYALDLIEIRRLSNASLLPQWSHLTVSWRYKTPMEVTTPPVAIRGAIDFASRSRSLYSVDAATREIRFQFETDEPVSAPLATDGTYLYMAARDFNIYCIDGFHGAVRWEFKTGLPTYRQARVIGNEVFVMPARGGMYCLTTESGREKWRRPKIVEFLAATPSTVFASDLVGNVVLLDRRNRGAVRGAMPLRQFNFLAPNDRTDRLFLVTTKGTLVCLREKDLDFPLFHRFPERKPLLPEFSDDQPAGGQPQPPDPNAPAPGNGTPPPDGTGN